MFANGSRTLGAVPRLATSALLIAALAAIAPSLASAAAPPLVVDDTRDRIDSNIGNGVCRTAKGTCTLRAAVQEANALPGANEVQLPAGVYELEIPTVNDDLPGTGDHDVTDSVTISGAGAGLTVIDGGFPLPSASPEVRGLDRLFEIHPTAGNVTISGLTLQEGYSGDAGGAIQNWSPRLLRLQHVQVVDNLAAKDGGAINNADPSEYEWASGITPPVVAIPSGRVEIIGSRLSGNAAGGVGAAINNVSSGSVSILSSSVIDNPGRMIPDPTQLIDPLDPEPVQFVPAAGVYNPGASAISNKGQFHGIGTIHVADSTVSGNYATSNGAGIYNIGSGVVRVERSRFERNTTEANGAAIHAAGGKVTIADSVFTDNLAHANGGAFYSGGDLDVAGRRSSAAVSASTFLRNEARAHAGAVYSDGDGDLTLTDIAITDNDATDSGGGLAAFGRSTLHMLRGAFTGNAADNEGGGLFTATERPVTVADSVFTKNSAGVPGEDGNDAGGGGVYTENGPFELTGTTIAENTATNEGGGLAIDNHGNVLVADTVVRNNTTPTDGGGIENSGARVTFERLLVANNRATLDGGGIHNSSSGEFTVLDTTVRDNKALNGGGFTNASDSTLVVRRSLFYRNTARRPQGVDDVEEGGYGGGFYGISDGGGFMENSTVSSSRANVRGGGMFHDADASFKIVNTTIWRNSAPFGGGISTVESDFVPSIPPQPNPLTLRNTIVGGSLEGGSCDAMLTSDGGNLDSGTGCMFQGTRDRGNSPAALDAIADNGGPTLTHAPRGDSIAVDWGLTPCPEEDQRGVTRPKHLGCDAGAVEYDGPLNPPDVTPPDTQYLAGPIQDSLETVAFQFTGSDDRTLESDLAYECRLVEHALDEPPEPVAPWQPVPPELLFVSCMSGWQRPLLEEGLFTFEVRAIDRAGNVDPTPAVHLFDGMDTVPPDTIIADKPPNPSGSRAATFTFTGTDNVTPPQFMEYECRIDTRDPELWLECFSPTFYSNLTTGTHTIEVRASDGADNMDPTPARYTWTVEQPADCDQANITLTPAADAWVDQVTPLENFVFHTDLTVRSEAQGAPETGLIPSNARALVRFPINNDAAQCELESAALRLYSGSNTPGRTLHAVPLTGPWKESTVTWSNQPGIAGAPVATSSGNGYREWDVLEHVEAMMESGVNYGWSIRDAAETDPDGGDQSFVSREMPQDPPDATLPELVLRYKADDAAPPPPPAAPTTPTTVHCGQVLTESTLVANDLTDCPGEGLVIGRPNIMVDLGGHTIDGPDYLLANASGQEEGFPAGIRNSGHTNVVIRNGTIQQLGYGVLLSAGTTRNVLEDLTIKRNAVAGVELLDADDGRNGNTVQDSVIADNELGVQLIGGSENSVVRRNRIEGNLGEAILLQSATGNRIEDNRIHGIPSDPLLDSDGGVLLTSASRNVLAGNTIHDTGDAGIVINQGSHGNRVEDQVLFRNGDAGVIILDSDRNQVIDTVAHQESDGGVVVNHAGDTVVRGSDLRFNPSGVEASEADRLVVEDNDASESLQTGFEIGNGVGIRIARNVANRTGGAGISLAATTFDAAGNPIGTAVIADNTANENLADGIEVAGGGHRVARNDAHNNGALGISAEGNVDGGGNRASGNAVPEQCVGVVCDTSGAVPRSEPDTTAPVTVIESHPPDPSITGSATFTFRSTDAGTPETAMRYECRLDPPPDPLPDPEPPPDTEPPEPGEPPEPPDTNSPPDGAGWSECISPIHFHELDEGRHHFEVRALDQADNRDMTPATHDWSIEPRAEDEDTGQDAIPPETRISAGPANPTLDDTATFRFTGSDNFTPGSDLRFQCRLDSQSEAAFESCQPGKRYVDLSVGSHTFEVRALDRTGNPDPTPGIHTWVVLGPPPDTTAPETAIDSGPDPTTVRTDARFTFSTNDPHATFECSLDEGEWVECASPHEYTGLNAQPHELRVRAVDQALNTDPSPARYAWTITPAPVDTAVFCGQIVTRSIRVTNDLANCQFNGLVIGADAITVDLNGHTIDGVGLGAGIRNDGYDSVTIRGGKVVDYDYGVALNPDTAHNIVESMTLEGSQIAGIALGQPPQPEPNSPTQPVASTQSKVESNTLRDNELTASKLGIWLSNGTKGTLVRDNTLAATAGDGIFLENATANRVQSNAIDGSSGHGIALEGAVGNTVADNTLTGNDAGILVGATTTGTIGLPSTENRVERNSLDETGGLDVVSSHENELIENVVKRATVEGLSLYQSNDNLARANDLRGNNQGISLAQSSGNRLEGNDASDSGATGIAVANLSFSNVLLQNTSGNNDGDGIYIGDEAAAGSGSLIERNRTNNNKGNGIYAPKPSHTFKANSANDNGSWGIWVSQGSNGRVNVDGGGNRAVGNNGPLDPVTLKPQQCFVIQCEGGAGQASDVIAPDTSIMDGPPDTTTADSAAFRFTGTDNASAVTFQCSLDGAAFGGCTSPVGYDGLAVGSHTFAVRAVDGSGNVDLTPATRTWQVGAEPVGQPPETTIGSGPDLTTTRTDATFTFSASERSTFECALDTAAFTDCTSPVTYRDLTVGMHTFQVRATDAEANVDQTPAVHSWRVAESPVAAEVACGEFIVQSTRLLNDLTDCPGHGLIVGAPGITIDLDGHMIDGVGLDAGIVNHGHDSVTVTNGTLREFDYGVLLNPGTGLNVLSSLRLELNQNAGVGLADADEGGSGNTVRGSHIVSNGFGVVLSSGTRNALIRDNVFSTNAAAAVRIEHSRGNRVTANKVDGSGGAGVVMEGGGENTIADNVLRANLGVGVAVGSDLLPSNGNRVERNTIEGSGASGIAVFASAGTHVLFNEVRDSGGMGVTLDVARDSLVRGNDLRSNATGIDVTESSGNRIESNNASGALGGGIALEAASIDNEIVNNTTSGNGGAGIAVEDSAPSGQGNLLERNTADANGGDGIAVAGAGHTLTSNIVRSNGGWGIYAPIGATDGGGNFAAGNAETDQCLGVVCTLGEVPGAPDTQILDKPPLVSNSRNAGFTYIASDDTTPLFNMIFECRLDSTSPLDWVDCEYPHEVLNLSPGRHTLEIRAVDAGLVADPTPATYTWTYSPLLANDPPEVILDRKPDAETWSFDALFTFHADEPDVTLECRVDTNPYEPCGFQGPGLMSQGAYEWSLTEEEAGLHTFRVRAADFEGNVGTPTAYTWRLLGPVTSFLSGPGFIPATGGQPATGGEVESSNATIDFRANVADATYECSLDLEPFTPCTPPVTYTGLAVGSHELQVVATDLATGVSEEEAAIYEWEVLASTDATAPETSIERAPASGTSTTIFEFAGTDAQTPEALITFECRLDSSSELDWTSCTSPYNLLDFYSYADPEMAPGEHTFEVRAIDAADPLVTDPSNPNFDGNVDPTPARHTWVSVADTTPPGTGILSGPAPRTGELTAAFDFFGTDNATPNLRLRFECSVNGADFAPCSAPHSMQLAPGEHTFRIRAVDLAGNVDPTPATRTWTIAAPPVTTISGPASPSTTEAAVFEFSADQAGSTFECSLNGAELAPCTSPHPVRIETDGEHTFEVRATNPEGIVEDPPARYVWTAELAPDSIRPNTTLTSGPPPSTSNSVATFTFTGSDNRTLAANLTFECALDGTAYSSCTSPEQFSDLVRGRHVLLVRSRDAAGNFDSTPARHEWTVAPPPVTTILSGPESPSEASTVTFTFASDVPDATFECWLDGPKGPCTSPVTYQDVAWGEHIFAVRATDSGGQTNPQWTEWDWLRADTTPPLTTITSGPGIETESTRADFTFIANEPGVTFQCSLDGAPLTSCASALAYPRLHPGTHRFMVQAIAAPQTDPFGQVIEPADPVPTVYEWTVVDRTAPDTAIDFGPRASTASTNAVFGFGSEDPTATFECSLDGQPFVECASPAELSELTRTAHSLVIRAIDLAGNVDPTPARYDWTITEPPLNTPVGTNVTVELQMPDGPGIATVSFFEVTLAGGTVLDSVLGGAPLPAGYSQGGSRFYEITTTAEYGEPATVCLPYDPASFTTRAIRLLELDGTTWADITMTNDPSAGRVCGEASNFSGFAIAAATSSVAPLASITSAPPNPSDSGTATFAFAADIDGATMQCSIDGQPFTACTSPVTYTHLDTGDHSFQVQAMGPFGFATPALYEWNVVLPPDTTAPDTRITKAPPALTGNYAVMFELTGSDDQSVATELHFECSVDGGLFEQCSSPYEVVVTTPGQHRIEVRAVDLAGNVDATPVSRTWTVVDVTPPDTSIVSGPPSGTEATSATFELTGIEPDGTAVNEFECSLDGADFVPCGSPHAVHDLAAGPHVLQARAKDLAGIVDPSPDVYEWEITGPADTTAPDTTIVAAPPAVSGPDVTFGFNSNELTSGFECSLDAGPFEACQSLHELVGVAAGVHVLAVRAVDLALNVDPTPAEHRWTVLGPPETRIDSQPADPSPSMSATFTFSSEQAGVTFQCSVDGSEFAACTSPFTAGPLVEGAHTFEVRAVSRFRTIDGQPVLDETPATYAWTVDVPPDPAEFDTTLTSTPPAHAQGGTTALSTFVFVSDPLARFECSLDGAPFEPCEPPAVYEGLPDGHHTFAVRAVDLGDNPDPTPATFSWLIEQTPDTTLDSASPPAQTDATAATFTFSSNRTDATFECSLDRAPFTSCVSGITYTDVPFGEHEFAVRAKGPFGTVDETPAIHTWESGHLTAPDVQIVTGPDASTVDTTATFTFTSGDPDALFLCSLDGAPPMFCSSPKTYENVTPGQTHTLTVEATKPHLLVDGTAATYTWEVRDEAPPETTIVSGPPAIVAEGTQTMFEFTGSDNAPAAQLVFECSVDGGPFSGCSSPHQVQGLAAGEHTLAVRAVDQAGNADSSPATHQWRIAPQAETTIDTRPESTTESRLATFTFSGNDTDATFECSLDGAAFTSCASPKEYTGLALGLHRFEVRSTNRFGLTDATPASFEWNVVDTTPPETTIDSGPDQDTATASRSAAFSFSSDEANVTFECSLDGAPFTLCDSPREYSVAPGSHELLVQATDPSENTDPTPARWTWTVVDAPPPPPPAPGGPQPTTVACGQVLTQSTLVQNDLTDCPGEGLVIGASNVVVDLNGHTIDGPDYLTNPLPTNETLPAGIRNSGFDNVRITDGTVQQFGDGVLLKPGSALNALDALTVTRNAIAGVQLSGAENATVGGNTILDNASGIALFDGSQGALVIGNTLNANLNMAIHVLGASGNRIEANSVSGLLTNGLPGSDGGVRLDGATNNVLLSNTVADTGDSGIVLVQGSHGNRVEGNTLTRTGDSGVHVQDSDRTEVIGNVAHHMSDNGVGLSAANDSLIRGNDVRFNAGGIEVEGASSNNRIETNDAGDSGGAGISIAGDGGNNVISGNTANRNGAQGIYVDGEAPAGSGNLISGNTANHNLGGGIRVAQGGHTIAGNTANDNAGWGIYAADGNIDGGGNNAKRNAEPGQCFGIVCNEPPDTTIVSGPDAQTESTTATFSFGSDRSGVTFECALDVAVYRPCDATTTYTDLAPGERILLVRAVDADGDADPTPARHDWEIGEIPPSVTITSAPAATTVRTSATFEFTAEKPNTTFECSLDGVAFAPCDSPQGYSELPVGQHTFQVRAHASAAAIVEAPISTHIWTIEPPAECTAAPVTLSASADSWVDQGATAANKGTDSVLKVMSKGPSNNVRALIRFPNPPLPQNCGVASAALRLYAASAASSRSIQALRITQAWTESGVTWSNQPATTGTAAAVTSAIGWREWDVSSQVQAMYHAGANHGLLLRDLVENGGGAEQQFNSREKADNPPQLVITFGLPDLTDPRTTIDSGPNGVTTSRKATVTFSSNEQGSTFECSLDKAAWEACTSPKEYTGLELGTHNVRVRATDPAGNVDATPARYDWRIEPDTTAPETTIGSAPAAMTTNTSASFTFSADEAGSTFECSLDGAAFEACSSPKDYGGLALGDHTFRVRATDSSGNTDGSPASHSWKIEAPSCTGSTFTAAADRDSWVLQSSSSVNKGTDSILKVDSKSGANARTLVRFALPAIPTGCTVTGAKLRLYASSFKSGRTLNALRINGAWTESAVTWATQPPVTGTAAQAPSRSSAGYVEWAVTSHVQSMYSGTNHGFQIRDATEGGSGNEQSFHSRSKAPDNPPQLVITFG